MEQSYILLDVLFNERDEPTDIYYIEANEAANRITGIELAGKTAGQLYPDFKQYWYEVFGRIAKTGNAETHEVSADLSASYRRFYAFKVGQAFEHKVAVIYENRDTGYEEKIVKIKARQKQEVIRVLFSALEEERRRVAESLHSSIGQILYSIKLSLANIQPFADVDEFEAAIGYTNKLLTDAIVEVRRISHGLMPTRLEESGLKNAIRDICEQLSDGVSFTFNLTGPTGRLDKYLELAIYRIIQELMTNVVKHANASVATVDISIEQQQITIRVSDNGNGMDPQKAHTPGIGLASIKSKIKLLNGKMNIDPKASVGTKFVIIIPMWSKKKDIETRNQ
ncbi:sensor histidine kinase [Mucilaginibacter panaciglaebae]